MKLGFTYNGVHSSTYGLLGSPIIPVLPERRRSTVEIPGRDGTFDFNVDSYAPRIIAVECLAQAASRAALVTALAGAAAWLSGNGYLVFDHDTTKRWQAKVYTGIDPRHSPRAAQFTIMFEVQPFAEDVNATTGTIGTAQNYGSAIEFYPVITITKSGTSAATLQLALASTGELVLVTDTIAAGDVLVFDMATGKVTKNGVACMDKVSITSLFFGVPPGTQTISVTTTSTYTASISYRKRYLYA
jgi:phage-related protein